MSATDRSRITLEEPDVAHWCLAGDVTADDIREIYELQLKFCKDKPYVFVLVDVSKIRSITAEARKLAAQGPTPGKTVMPIRANVVYGASFHFRVIGTLIAKAAHFIHRGQDNPTRFFENEADGRAWLAQRRIEIGASPVQRK
jgi:hypothetical protein